MLLFYLFVAMVTLVVMLNSAQADEFINTRHGISKRDEESVCLKSQDICKNLCQIVDFEDELCVEGEDELCTCEDSDDAFTAPLGSDESLEGLQRKKSKNKKKPKIKSPKVKSPKVESESTKSTKSDKIKNPLSSILEGVMKQVGETVVVEGVEGVKNAVQDKEKDGKQDENQDGEQDGE